MLNINSVTIAGRLTKDPELKALPSGISVCSFSVASNRTWKDKDGQKQEEAEFHNVVFFGKTAEVISKYFAKGREIYVEGRLKTQKWEKDGVNHYRTEIIGNTFQFVGSNSDGERKSPTSDGNESVLPDYPEDEINPEDIPF